MCRGRRTRILLHLHIQRKRQSCEGAELVSVLVAETIRPACMGEGGGRGGEKGGRAFYYTYIYSGKRQSCEGAELVGVLVAETISPTCMSNMVCVFITAGVGEYHLKAPFHLPMADFITVWHLQPGRVKLDFGADFGKLGRVAFGDENHRRWVNDVNVQASFAHAFFVPINEQIPLKRVSSDVPNTPVKTEFCRSNLTSKVLHAFRAMHPQTELDIMQDHFYEKVIIGQQRTSRELLQLIDSGPFGGLQGKPVDVLWRVFAGEEVTNISEQTLQLVQAIGMAMQGSKGDSLACMVRTEATDYYVRGKSGLSKIQCGVHTLREYNFHEAAMHAGRCAVDDIDERISERVWKYRFPNEDVPLKDKEKLSRLVHTRFKSNRPELAASAINVQAQPPTIDPVIVDIWIYKDIFAAWDEKTQERTNVTVEGIYILPKCAPCDPLVILKSIAENNPAASTLVLGTFSHMLQCWECKLLVGRALQY
jgi:hypothetical protein